MSAWRFLTTLPHRRTGEHHTVPIISVEAYRSVRSRREHPEDARALVLAAAEVQKDRTEAVEEIFGHPYSAGRELATPTLREVNML